MPRPTSAYALVAHQQRAHAATGTYPDGWTMGRLLDVGEHYRFGVEATPESQTNADAHSYFAYALGRRGTPVSGEVILLDVASPGDDQASAPVLLHTPCPN